MLGSTEGFGGLVHIARLHPEDRPIPPGPGSDRVECRYVDPGLAQLGHELSDCANSIIALDKKPCLGADELDLSLPGSSLKRRLVGRDQVDLGTPAFGKAREGQQIHPGLFQHAKHPGPLPWLVGDLSVEVLHPLNRISHSSTLLTEALSRSILAGC